MKRETESHWQANHWRSRVPRKNPSIIPARFHLPGRTRSWRSKSTLKRWNAVARSFGFSGLCSPVVTWCKRVSTKCHALRKS